MTALDTATARPRKAAFSVNQILVRLSVLALIIRAVYIAMFADSLKLGWDATWYTGIGDSLAAGHGYSVTCPVISTCTIHQTALFPPVLPLLFAATAKIGLASQLGRGLFLALVGAVTVYVIGQVGNRVGGREVAIAAAVIAAFNPMMIFLEGALMSEEIATLLAATLMLLVIDQSRAVKGWRWVAIGGVLGLAALTRGEGPLWLLLIVLPSVFFLTVVAVRARLRGLLIVLATFIVVVTPWMIRNQHQFGTPYLGQPNLYGTLAATNCKAGYYGPNIGAWICSPPTGTPFGDFSAAGSSEPAQYNAARKQAFSYATGHATRLPIVVVAREARAWSVLSPFHFQTGVSRYRFTVSLYDWFLFAGSAIGIGLALRRKLKIWPLLLLLASVTITIAVTYGNPRYLATAEPALAVFAGLAIAPLFRPKPPAATDPDARESEPMSAPRRRLDALTPLRAIAAFAVFAYHYYQLVLLRTLGTGRFAWYRFGMSQGFVGVSFFFVLSGFVLAWSSATGSRYTTRDFYIRRFARVWPNHGAMWLAWAGLVFLGTEHTGVLPALANLVLVQAWFTHSNYVYSMIVPSWSLSVEVFFYLCFPALFAAAVRLSPRARAQVAVVLFLIYATVPVLLRNASVNVKGYPYHFPPYRMIEFVLGILLALQLKEGRLVKIPVGVATAFSAVAYIASGLLANEFAPVVTLIPFLVLIGSVAQADLGKERSTTRAWAVHLGVVSFAFYLTQWLVLGQSHHRFFKNVAHWGIAERTIVFGVCLLLALALAELLHAIIEQNGERILRRKLLGTVTETVATN